MQLLKYHRFLRVSLAVFVLALLVGCRSDEISFLTMPLPKLRVDKTIVAVGEPVTVSVLGGFDLSEGADVTQRDLPVFRVGACFKQDASATGAVLGGLCTGTVQNLPVPTWITILDGAVSSEDYRGLVIQRGQTLLLKQSFVFTLTEPREVTLVATVETNSDQPDDMSETDDGESLTVVFE